MKSRLNYKSRKTIIITAIIIALLAISATGIYMFTKGNDEARAFTEGNTMVEGSESPVVIPEEGTTPEEPTVEPNVGSENNEEQTPQGGTTNSGTTATQTGTTTSTTASNVPNQEYVTERQEEVERLAEENFSVTWNPVTLVAMATTINLDEAEEIANYEVTKVATLVNGEAIIRNENGEITNRVKPGDKVTYVITVKNTGNVTLKDIKVVDELADYEATIPLIAIGDSKELEVLYTVENDNIENDTIKNIVKVTIPGVTPEEEPKETEEVIPANKYIPISGEKTWIDNDNQNNTRPESITINVLNGEEIVDTITVKENEEGKWLYASKELPKYDEDNNLIDYKVEEISVEGYTTIQDGYNFKNVINSYKYTVEYYYDGELGYAVSDMVAYGTKIEQYKDGIETGYKLEKVENIPLIVSDKAEENIIKVYYVKDEFTYIVNYYYDGKMDPEKTDRLKATYGDTITTYTDKNITGYELDTERTGIVNLVITEKATQNTINIYYKKAEFTYIVNYYYDGKMDSEKTDRLKATYGDTITTYVDKNITGYELDAEKTGTVNLVITEKATKNTINVYYKKAEFEYVVNYYYDGKVNPEKTDRLKATYGDTITTYTDKNITGYKLDTERTGIVNLTISENTEKNVIDIYYVKDEFGYTVKYYKDGEKTPFATSENLKATYGEKIEAKDVDISNKPAGYKLEKEIETLTISENVEENVINVYYVKDEFGYTVKYYKDGETTPFATSENLKATYGEKIEAKDVDISNKPAGYKLEKEIKTLTISENLEENVIDVYYVKDEFNYIVNYYKDSKSKENFLDKIEESALYGSLIKADTTKFIPEGYKFEGEVPSIIIDTKNNEIDVIYTKNNYTLTVNYVYEDGSEASEKYTETVEYNANYSVTSPVVTGYTVDKATISGTMPANDVTDTVIYKRNTYNVVYKITGSIDTNNNYKTETYEYGANITKLANLVKEGYTFSGWSEVPTTMPSHDVEVTGYFEAINVTLTKTAVDNKGNEVDALYKYKAGDTVKYKLTVTNNGTLPISEYTVTDTLPQELRFANNETEGVNENTLTWNIKNLEAGRTVEKTVTTILNDSSTWQTKTSSELTNIRKPSTSTNRREINCAFFLYNSSKGEVPYENGNTTYPASNYTGVGFGRVSGIEYDQTLSSVENLNTVINANNNVVSKITYAPEYNPGEGKVVLWYVAKRVSDSPTINGVTKSVTYHVDGIIVDVEDVYSITNTINGLYGVTGASDIVLAKKPSTTGRNAVSQPTANSYSSANVLTKLCSADITDTEETIKILEQTKTESANISNNNLTTNTNNEVNKEKVKPTNETTNTTNTVVEETKNNIETITNVVENANNIVEEVNTTVETNKEQIENKEKTIDTVENKINETEDITTTID